MTFLQRSFRSVRAISAACRLAVSPPILRAITFVLLIGFASASPAGAANVYIQWAGPTAPSGGVIRDPVFATNTVGGSFVEADINNPFRGLAYADGAAQSSLATVAYSGIEDLFFTNNGAAPATFGGVFPFDVQIDASFTHDVDPAGVGSWTTQLIGTLFVSVPGETPQMAQVSYSSAEIWNEGLQATAFEITPTVLGGGSVLVRTGTVGALSVRLSIGTITLDPGELMTVSMTLQPVAIAVGTGFGATTDMSSTARIRMVLPAGVTLSNNASVPLGWVTVPEPSSNLLLCVGLLGLVCIAGEARGRDSKCESMRTRPTPFP